MIFRIINKFLHVFSHPDYTVGTRFSPVPASKSSRAYRSKAHHRRLGISPDPEDDSVVTIKKTFIYMRSMKKVCSNKPMIFSHHKQILASSLIQTILSVLDSHQLLLRKAHGLIALTRITVDWEFHPTPKIFLIVAIPYH